MRKIKPLASLAVIVALLTSSLAAQVDVCKALLANGVFDTRQDQTKYTSYNNHRSFYCSAAASDYGSAKALDAFATVPIDDVLVGFGLKANASDYNKWRSQLCSSDSVGLAAIQIANYAGATSIALTRTSAKRKQLIEAGATHVIATEEVDLVEEVMRITDGKGARVVFDPVGGPNFPKLISALAFQGTVYIYGALAEGDTPMPVLAMIAKMPVIKGHNIWLTTGDEARRKAAVAFVLKGLESGALKPVIDRAFKFDDMVEVHRYLENNGQFGKIVVTV